MRSCIYLAFFILTNYFVVGQPSYYLTADRVFDGEVMHEGWAVLVQGDKIISVGAKDKVVAPSNIIKTKLPSPKRRGVVIRLKAD